jgi:hypothetical protein
VLLRRISADGESFPVSQVVSAARVERMLERHRQLMESGVYSCKDR